VETLLLIPIKRVSTFAAEVTSETAMAFGRAILERFPVDWARAGFDEQRLAELLEHMLRTIRSFVLDPGRPPRAGQELRRYLARWIAPSVARPRAWPIRADVSPRRAECHRRILQIPLPGRISTVTEVVIPRPPATRAGRAAGLPGAPALPVVLRRAR